jgi:hypothetical protein
VGLEGRRTQQQSKHVKVFISYAREDSKAARRLYDELKNAGLDPWLDQESILPGQIKSITTKKAIRESRFFVALLSNNSVKQRGDVQRQLKGALDVFKEFLESDIFLIPARLDDCQIPYYELQDIKYVDLFPRWEEGVERILQAIGVTSEPVLPRVLSPRFRGEKRIFVDREEYINSKIKECLKKPASRVSIIGPGGSGKSQLAFKAIHQYEKEGIFDLVIPVYLDAGVIPFDQFLLKLADKLDIREQIDKHGDIDERKNIVTNMLGKKSNPLILVDSFETLLYAISSPPSLSSSYSSDIKDNAIQIKYYLNNNIPDNTSILVTSRERVNLNEEKRIDLEGLAEDDSNKLFERLVVDEQLKELSSEEQTRLKINDMIKKTGGHPLSIEVLAKNLRSIEQVEQVSEILGSYINKDEPNKRLQSLEESLGFTINKLDDNLKQLLSNLILFTSSFPISAAIKIFGAKREDILDLYDRTMLTRIAHILRMFQPGLKLTYSLYLCGQPYCIS